MPDLHPTWPWVATVLQIVFGAALVAACVWNIIRAGGAPDRDREACAPTQPEPRRPVVLPALYRVVFDRIAERLLRDAEFADQIHRIEELSA
jgi:hypothetical protein